MSPRKKQSISPSTEYLAAPPKPRGNCTYCAKRMEDCSNCLCDRNVKWCGCAERPVTAGNPPEYNTIPKFLRANWRCNFEWKLLEDHLEGWRKDMGLDLDPPFQRAHVWSREQQIAYVEYRLREGPSARELLFNCKTWDTMDQSPIVLVDGKQRLTAVLAFLRNEIPAFGHLRRDYVDRIPHSADFVFHVNNLRTDREVLIWYLQINAGGTPHTPEELDKVRKMLETHKND